jgi:hypothetical protein
MDTPNKVKVKEDGLANDSTVGIVTPESGHALPNDTITCEEEDTPQKITRRALFCRSPEVLIGPNRFQGLNTKEECHFLIKPKISLKPNVKKVYSIVNAKTGSIGGNGHGGAIYGETTSISMQKIVELMKTHTGLNQKSRFIDVGSGLGKPNLHVAQDPGVELSFGIEMEKVRWMLSMHNLHHVLKEAEIQIESQQDLPKESIIGYNCFFSHGDVTDAYTFDPFTHVYMFDIGFPPTLFEKLSDMFNRSCSTYLICYHAPRLIVDRYKFQVELLCQQNTAMHGSSENHTCYIYRRTGFTENNIQGVDHDDVIPCDPLFKDSWSHVRKGLCHMSSLVQDKLSTALKTGRSKRSREVKKC